MPKRLDPPALQQRFGRLKVVIPVVQNKKNTNGCRTSLCLCDCGELKTVAIAHLYSGSVKSCGCLNRELSGKRVAQMNTTHGRCQSAEYRIYNNMKTRCLNPSSPKFHQYKDRGICQRWLNSFEAFYRDMGPRPSPKHSIDRIDNDGPYAPDNCRWATQPEQGRNRSTNVNLTFQGRSQCVTAWAEELGMKPTTLYMRIIKRGWSVERALTTPVRKAKPG